MKNLCLLASICMGTLACSPPVATVQKWRDDRPMRRAPKTGPKVFRSKNFELTFRYTPGQEGGRLILRNISKKTRRASGFDRSYCLKLVSSNSDLEKVNLGPFMEELFHDVPPGGALERMISFPDFVVAAKASGRYWVRILYDDSYANDYYSDDFIVKSEVGKVTSNLFLIEVVNFHSVIVEPRKQ